MRKITLTLALIAHQFIHAQEGFYAGFQAGYGFPAGPRTRGINQNNNTVKAINGSFNHGLNLGLNLGYNFNKHCGADLGMNYLMGSPLKTTSTSGSNNSVSELKANFIFIQPSLTLSAGLDKFNPYVKLGPSIGLGSFKEAATETGGYGNSYREVKYFRGIALGIRSAIGANYKLTNKLHLNLELWNVYMSYAPSKGEITKATYNGQNVLGMMDIRDKKTDFVDSYDRSVFSPPNEPSKELKTSFPLSAIGLNIGLRFYFGS